MNQVARLMAAQMRRDLRALPAATRRRHSTAALLERCLSVDDVRALARRRVPRPVFDYVDGAAWDEVTARRNRSGFAALSLLPRVLAGVADVDLSTTLLGHPVALPIVGAPTGLTGLTNHLGEPAVAAALHGAGTHYALSFASSYPVEDVARAAPGALWLQVYLTRDRGHVQSMVDRARAVGCRALMVTVDCPRAGPRERDIRNGFAVPPRVTLRTAAEALRRPRWTAGVVRNPRVMPAGVGGDALSLSAFIDKQFDPGATWADVERIRALWDGPLVIKGIMHPDDARTAVAAGADAIVVSNHGGRQLDQSSSTIAALPGAVEAVGGAAEVYVDGGVRRGTDIVKALALGARAVLLGRPLVYGLGAGGEAGARKVIDLLAGELRLAMALAGLPALGAIDKRVLGPVEAAPSTDRS